MRKVLVLHCVSILIVSIVHGQGGSNLQHFSLLGIVEGKDSGIIVLQYWNDETKKINDTAILQNGQFRFSGGISGVVIANLVGSVKSMALDDPNRTTIFLEPTDMKITLKKDQFQSAVVIGSKTQSDVDELKKQQQYLKDSLAALRMERKMIQNDISLVSKRQLSFIDSLYTYYQKGLNHIKYSFVASHEASPASPYLMLNYSNDGISADSAWEIYNCFDQAVKDSRYGRALFNSLLAKINVTPGKKAPDFERKDIRGNEISLASFLGKSYILLDFWGSTCAPCRELTPHLLELYSKYHSHGFEVIAVSDDGDVGKWKTAIAFDKMGIWHNVRKYPEGGASSNVDLDDSYYITSTPILILIDKMGTIVNRYRGAGSTSTLGLDKDLESIFK